MSNTKDKKVAVAFAAIDPYLERNIVSPREAAQRGRDLVEWGDGNAYPDYLLDLYNSVPTLRSIVAGTADYICGNDATILPLREGMAAMNTSGETIAEQVRRAAFDYLLYGGFAMQVIRGRDGRPSEVYVLDMRFVRSNKENTVFYYCEDWGKRGHKEVLVYPKFIPLDWARLDEEERDRHASSVVYVKNTYTQTYPAPLYAAAVKACEIERCIDDFHLNAINNGFASSAIVNFNNGVPEDEIKEEIERDFVEKYSGHQNAGRIMFSWNPNKESATDIVEPEVKDFGERYKALSDHSRQQIFTAFRANPNLFGIPTEGNGFANEEYEESFRLYNRTQVRPAQRMICDAYDRIYQQAGVLSIVPFSVDEDRQTEQTVN